MRAAVLGNGHLYLGWDSALRLREMFWPRVGLSNHLQESRDNRLVLCHDGLLYDLLGDEFVSTGRYLSGMGFEWRLRNKNLALEATVTDWVDPYLPVWARAVQISPPPVDCPAPAAIYSVQAYALGENTIGEEACFDAGGERLYHFKGPLWVAIRVREATDDASTPDSGSPTTPASLRGAVAKVRDGGVRFSPDGGVEGRQVDHGLLQSAVGLVWAEARVARVECLLAFGRSRGEADRNLDQAGDAASVATRSRFYWARASAKARGSVSVMVLAAHCDRGGGVLASCDTDILGDYRDHYRYVWPRDAAMCVSALLKAGFTEYSRRYLAFCARAVCDRGFFFQRYRSDGTRGSGWHAWQLPGGDLPLQEDETALSLVAAGDYLGATGDLDALNRAYLPFVRKAGLFILEYTSEKGTLVRPSYDLWEERRGAFTFTQSACIAGLLAASKVAGTLGRRQDSDDFREGAGLLLSGLALHLSDEERGYCRGIVGVSEGDPRFDRDWTDDASLFLVPLMLPPLGVPDGLWRDMNAGMLATAWRRSALTWTRLKDSLAVTLPGMQAPGYARYTGDWYSRSGDAHGVLGNPWPVATAWYALSGVRLGFLGHSDVVDYVKWFETVASATGLMPEQLDCLSGESRSVSPLAWSHAMYLELLLASGQAQDAADVALAPDTAGRGGEE